MVLITEYLGLSPAERARLRIPLERLNSSKLHLWVGHVPDSALDLGIALEALLCSDDLSVDISYRFKMRGAILRGGNLALRQKTSVLLGALYSLRSDIAHGKSGIKVKIKNRPKIEGNDIEAFLLEIIDLTMELLEIVVRRGSIPDWEKVMLTGLAD